MNNYIATYYNAEKLAKAWAVIRADFLRETGVTLYITLMATLFAILIGLPLGVLLVTGDQKGIRPLPKPLMAFLNGLINLLRSAPFIILIVVLMPITRAIVGRAVGNTAVIVPLIYSVMFVDWWHFWGFLMVMFLGALPSLITSFTTAVTTILGYTAMSGAVGGGGLGNLAITQGQQRYNQAVLLAALIVLVILVQVFQTVGTRLAKRMDKRIKE